LTIPHRGTTTESTYFVTANVFQRKSLFQVEKIARLFIEVLLSVAVFIPKMECTLPGSAEIGARIF
jgi:hypothetical protein